MIFLYSLLWLDISMEIHELFELYWLKVTCLDWFIDWKC